MEIKIKHDQNGAFKIIAEARVNAEDNDNAREILNSILKSVETQIERLWEMGLDPEATPRNYEVTLRPRNLIIN